MPFLSSRRSRDMTELLSEVYDADRLANNPRTIDFLEAGERLLRDDLLRDAEDLASVKGRPPFEEVLAFLTRRRVVGEAQRARKGPDGEPASGPTVAAYRYRWRTQVGYLRDLVIWALCPRMERPIETGYASEIIDAVQDGGRLADAITEITAREVQTLKGDQAFRLQMIFQATLAHDPRVADALYRIDKANVEAWTEFARRSYAKLGLTLRSGASFEELGCALHAAGEGVLFRAMLAPRPDHAPPPPDKLLALIAKALVIATADRGDGAIDEILDQSVQQSTNTPPSQVGRPDSSAARRSSSTAPLSADRATGGL
jgi:hypothetical protein